ncbi:MAG: heme-copper oxidase subunit III family protein [Pseudomonadota bacterium]
MSAFHETPPTDTGWQSIVGDWSGDRAAFRVPWGKAMMWIFLLSDTFIFGSFLASYMTVRISTTAAWPNTSEVFSLSIGSMHLPLLLIAIMTFILISSSGTMAMAVNFAYRRERIKSARLMLVTAGFGVMFVSMQAFEWTKLILEGVRPWSNPMGAAQFGSCFFMITGFHGLHVTAGVIYLSIVARRVLRGDYERSGNYGIVEIAGLYWHFVDLVWVFIFALFYLW